MSPIYMTSQSGALCTSLCISVTHFLGIIKLGWLLGAFKAQLEKWRKGFKGPSMGSRMKRFEYRKFPLSGKMILHTILQNHHGSWKYHRRFGKYDGYFCWYGILFLYIPNHGLFQFQKRLFNDLVAPFYLVLITCSHYRFGSGTS